MHMSGEFLRFSRFAPTLVAEERNKARRFQHGLSLETREYMTMTIMNTYAKVLKAARHQEQATGRMTEIGMQKRLACHMSKTFSSRIPPPKHYMTPTVRPTLICNYCQLLGYTKGTCKRALGLCLNSDVAYHQMGHVHKGASLKVRDKQCRLRGLNRHCRINRELCLLSSKSQNQ